MFLRICISGKIPFRYVSGLVVIFPVSGDLAECQDTKTTAASSNDATTNEHLPASLAGHTFLRKDISSPSTWRHTTL
ncbi:hypothetical protein EB796_017882 [Bugula neritina]|uniref:Uncharacterized protein n=1 Tax=Bugula neritina TaxID=10212 RepID=A0A7J7JCK4_BUGNE|nr:hypothetical protein EB796_017882 [Bugula neritina]